ncbi:MAG: hypothetical protein DDT42_01817 [candidate division WS2 bacterium]|uniref:Six-cysteine peptide SCIFF n=1 Tax=Psychracetigena formicireducens TaxID=2986056 RepID=A0A9E2BIR7_PSYF1|nr:hypothetical protein [Candidatus Psychracetigena formicireducens]MBT9145939.1 hypothetical protein [Candidatus Psychracetigena formicireducens]
MKKIKIIFKKALKTQPLERFKVSCQSACKTSCTIANQTNFLKPGK